MPETLTAPLPLDPDAPAPPPAPPVKPCARDAHVSFTVPESGTMRYRVYGHDRVRLDVTGALSIFLTNQALDCLIRQLAAAKADLIKEWEFPDPLLEVWDSAVTAPVPV